MLPTTRRNAESQPHGERADAACRAPTVLLLQVRDRTDRGAGLPVREFQVHVEMDERAMMERAAVYRDSCAGGENGLGRLAARWRPAPEAATLFDRFLTLAAGARGEGR